MPAYASLFLRFVPCRLVESRAQWHTTNDWRNDDGPWDQQPSSSCALIARPRVVQDRMSMTLVVHIPSNVNSGPGYGDQVPLTFSLLLRAWW